MSKQNTIKTIQVYYFIIISTIYNAMNDLIR